MSAQLLALLAAERSRGRIRFGLCRGLRRSLRCLGLLLLLLDRLRRSVAHERPPEVRVNGAAPQLDRSLASLWPTTPAEISPILHILYTRSFVPSPVIRAWPRPGR